MALLLYAGNKGYALKRNPFIDLKSAKDYSLLKKLLSRIVSEPKDWACFVHPLPTAGKEGRKRQKTNNKYTFPEPPDDVPQATFQCRECKATPAKIRYEVICITEKKKIR